MSRNVSKHVFHRILRIQLTNPLNTGPAKIITKIASNTIVQNPAAVSSHDTSVGLAAMSGCIANIVSALFFPLVALMRANDRSDQLHIVEAK
ncbi:hypothetical protein [Tunturiibacter psychrotolerans]|uniref:hypothetical protein n=1 Tax=Tunturiibacter psychrotolerans TaxID=3069686 RepID=UPI003D23C2F6